MLDRVKKETVFSNTFIKEYTMDAVFELALAIRLPLRNSREGEPPG
jgi:hypothetical protein